MPNKEKRSSAATASRIPSWTRKAHTLRPHRESKKYERNTFAAMGLFA